MAVKTHRLDKLTFAQVYTSGLKRGIPLEELAKGCGVKNAVGLRSKVERENDLFEENGFGRPLPPCPIPVGKRGRKALTKSEIGNLAAEIAKIVGEADADTE